MATGASVRSDLDTISVNRLQCSICCERYINPKVLDCQHSFCEKCLKEYHDQRYRGAAKIPCPLCRQETVLPETGIPGLKTNFHLIDLVEETALQDKIARLGDTKLFCDICDEDEESLYHCLDCGINICLNCRKIHMRFPVSTNHTVATFTDIRQGKVNVTKQPDEYKCLEHNRDVKQFYCRTCEELICHACTVADHSKPKHDVISIKTASQDYTMSLKKYFPAFSKDIQGLEESLRDTSEAKKVFSDNMGKTRRAVQDRAAEVIEQVKAEEERTLNEITVKEQDHNKRLNEHENTLTEMLQRKKHSLETAKDITYTASDTNFLSLYPVIIKDMEKLSSQHSPKVADMQSYPVFMQSQKVDISLGKVVQKDTWKLCHEFGKQGSGPREFQSARGIAAAEPDTIAVTDWENRRVVICNNQGQIKSSIPEPAYDVAAIHSQWVLANPDIVKVYNKDDTLASEFGTVPQSEVGKTDVYLCSVAVRQNGNIIVGDGKRNVLTEHSSTDQSLIHTIPVETTPYFLAVMNNDRIVISDVVKGRADVVDVVDGKAATASTIKPTIGGQPVRLCRGVSSNNSGIYIAVITDIANTAHIHHYDRRGQFVSCVARGLNNPQGITFTADGQQLAVADKYSVKVYHKV